MYWGYGGDRCTEHEVSFLLYRLLCRSMSYYKSFRVVRSSTRRNFCYATCVKRSCHHGNFDNINKQLGIMLLPWCSVMSRKCTHLIELDMKCQLCSCPHCRLLSCPKNNVPENMVFVPLKYEISRNSWGMLTFKTQLTAFAKYVAYALCLSLSECPSQILGVDRHWLKMQSFWLLMQVVRILTTALWAVKLVPYVNLKPTPWCMPCQVSNTIPAYWLHRFCSSMRIIIYWD
jgi:hypothetical protein